MTSSVETTVPYWTWRQTAKLLLIGSLLTLITNFPSAFTHTSVNTAVAALDEYINSSYLERDVELGEHGHTAMKTSINNCWFFGQIAGSLFSPYITDRFGRKPAYLLATASMTFACLLQTIATTISYPELLIVGRTLASVFSPMSDAVAILYLQEISPTHLRGVLSSLFATGYSVMAFLGMVLGMDSVLGWSLPLLLSVPVMPGVLSLVVLVALPETPKFLLISKKNTEGARRSLAFYHGDQPQNELILAEYQCEAQDESDSGKGGASMADLFRVGYLRQAMWLTFMVLTLCLPFYPILQCSTTFLEMVDIPSDIAQLSSSSIGVAMIVGCLFATGLLDRFPRRRLVIGFGWGSVAAILLFSVCGALVPIYASFKWGALAGMFLYIVCWSAAVGPISYFIGPELVPIQHRSAMFCVCYALNNIFIAATNAAALTLFRLLGAVCFVPLFVLPSTVAVLYLWRYLPETRNRETHIIVAALRAGKRTTKRIHPAPIDETVVSDGMAAAVEMEVETQSAETLEF